MAGREKTFAPFVLGKSRRKGEKGRAKEAVALANSALDALSFLYGKGENDGISTPVGEEIRVKECMAKVVVFL